MKYLLCALAVFVCMSASASTCSSTQYDMLNWFSLGNDSSTVYHLTGNANPLYSYHDSNKQRIYSVKGGAGYPWDVDYYDSNYIYQWATEYNWNDPTSYKAFSSETTMPWSPRCINKPAAGVYGTKLASITSPSSPYTIYKSNCVASSNNNLGYTANEIWGPTPMSLGGNLPNNALTLTLSYRYSCNSSYNNCSYKETFDLQYAYGLVRWTYYVLQNGQYVQQNQSVFNHKVNGGSPTPYHPCWQ
jgi:hypothetical protein